MDKFILFLRNLAVKGRRHYIKGSQDIDVLPVKIRDMNIINALGKDGRARLKIYRRYGMTQKHLNVVQQR